MKGLTVIAALAATASVCSASPWDYPYRSNKTRNEPYAQCMDAKGCDPDYPGPDPWAALDTPSSRLARRENQDGTVVVVDQTEKEPANRVLAVEEWHTAMRADESHDLDQAAISLLRGFNSTTNENFTAPFTPAYARHELARIAQSPTADFDAAIRSAYRIDRALMLASLSRRGGSTNADATVSSTRRRRSVAKRQINKWTNCGMELIVSTGCVFHGHHCQWTCIVQPHVFPYTTCGAFLKHGRCPREWTLPFPPVIGGYPGGD